MTGAGSVGEGGGGLECRFSLDLPAEDEAVEGVEELLDEVDDTDRFVFRRSRILKNSDCMES